MLLSHVVASHLVLTLSKKIDCEMCEWQTFHDWLADDVPMLHQILVEVHKAPKNAVDFFDSLEADGYMRFHKEPNIQVST